MRRAAIVCPIRTGVGKFLGGLSPLDAGSLGASILLALIERSGIDPERIDDVVAATGYPSGEAPSIGRYAALAAGLPESVPGMQLDRRCGAGLQAVIDAAMRVQTGAADVVVAAGIESMSQVEFYLTDHRAGSRFASSTLHDRLDRARAMAQPSRRYGDVGGMIGTADRLAAEMGITREECDTYAARSHARAAAGQRSGAFNSEIVAIDVPQRRGDSLRFAADEGIRPDVTCESLGRLPAIAGGVVSAGNASQQSDAAAACLVVAEERLEELGMEPMLFLKGWSVTGCDPARMGIGPVGAVRRLFERTGLGWNDIDLVELNEAFAAQVLACLRAWDYDTIDPGHEKLNVNGSGISLGHPIGATGLRMLATLAHEMDRRRGRHALATMCIGGGQGIAAIFERAA